jgi:hypothetical protein
VKLFCHVCERPIGTARKICADCDREKIAVRHARPGRLCSFCKVRPPTPRSNECSVCTKANYELEMRMLVRIVRPCRECGEPMPKGRRRIRCVPCHRLHQPKRQPRKACPICGRKRAKDRRYCLPCSRIEPNWRRAYHKGDPAARMLRKIQPRRQWQEKL